MSFHEQPQLRGKIGERFVVRCRCQKNDSRIALLHILGNGLVTPPFAVSQIVALVNQYQPVTLEVFQPFALMYYFRERFYRAAQTVFFAVVFPHRHQILRADDECFIVEIVFYHPRQCGSHHGFTQAHHVADDDAATPMQVACSNLHCRLLKLK
jgi:hypothetical protein